MYYTLPEEVKEENLIFNAIDELKNKKSLEMIYFVAPFCKETVNIDYFKKLKDEHISNLYNYSKIFDDNNLFSSCGHLNDKGAEIFTNRLIKDFFKK